MLQVKVSNFPFNNLIYSVTDRSCSNVIVGVDIQILTGVAFAANNLQSKVRGRGRQGWVVCGT